MDFGSLFEKKTEKKTKNEKVGFDMYFIVFREGRHVQKNSKTTGKKHGKNTSIFNEKTTKNR